MADGLLVLRDISACWCDERGRLGPPGRIRPMRVLVAREDVDTHFTTRRLGGPTTAQAARLAARYPAFAEIIRR